jgi:hypothetical protein
MRSRRNRTIARRVNRLGIALLECQWVGPSDQTTGAGELPNLEERLEREEKVAMTGWRQWIAAVAGLALLGVAAGPSPALAQQTDLRAQAPGATALAEGEGKAPNSGRVSLSLGADWASAYYFRGIANVQNGGSNVQPYAEVGFKLLENQGPLTALTFAPGIWNNFQYGDDGRLVEPSDPRFWFESDLYLKLSATWWDALTTAVTYTYYTSPNDSFSTYADVGLSVGLNDSKWLGDFALNPSLLVAFETKGEALASANGKKGIYMGLGLAPSYTLFTDTATPLTVGLPLTVGFSLKDYYTVDGGQTLGYVSGGPLLTAPLSFIPPAYGNWSLKAGVQLLWLNTNLETVNTGDNFVPIGSIGVAMTY